MSTHNHLLYFATFCTGSTPKIKNKIVIIALQASEDAWHVKCHANSRASFCFYRFEGEFYDGEHDVDKEDAYVEV